MIGQTALDLVERHFDGADVAETDGESLGRDRPELGIFQHPHVFLIHRRFVPVVDKKHLT